jgi:Domain of unknown function (DUF2017)
LHLSKQEQDLLRELATELESELDSRSDAPALERLFPTAYEDDVESEREYRRLTRDELLDGRRETLRVLASSLDNRGLSSEEGEAWLRALNDLRLVLGTRLDVTEDTFAGGLDRGDPRAPEFSIYAYLTWLQEQLVEALDSEAQPAG